MIGSSGGAIAAINMVLEHPEQKNAVIADSFEGLRADASISEQIRMGRYRICVSIKRRGIYYEGFF